MNNRALVSAQKVAAALDTPAAKGVLQRQCTCGNQATSGECEVRGDKKQLLRRDRATEGSDTETHSTVHEVLRSPGQALDATTREFFEPRFGIEFSGVPVQNGTTPISLSPLSIASSDDPNEAEADRVAGKVLQWQAEERPGVRYDFSQVRVHADAQAVESARMVNALAYTLGEHVVFGAGQYAPTTRAGRQLLAHELVHTIQQAASKVPKLQRSKTVQLTGHGKRSLTVVVGELRFTRNALDDVKKFGGLLPSSDQAHIGFYGDQLGYDPSHTDQADPFRWSKLRDLIDSDQKILVQKVKLPGEIPARHITPSESRTSKFYVPDLGYTLITESLHRRIYPGDTDIYASPSPDTHYVYYSTSLSSAAESSMAHELFGHTWLAIKEKPYVHPKLPRDIAARGTLTAEHKVQDPFGNVYTGTVEEFIHHYVTSQGAERAIWSSPTQDVGTQFLQQALTAFKTNFPRVVGGAIPPDVNRQWAVISNNYALAKPAGAGAGIVTPPASVHPSMPAPTPGPGRTPSAVQPAQSATPAITQPSIEQNLVAWFGTLDPDQQSTFIRFLRKIQEDIQRHNELTSRLLEVLPSRPGMDPAPSFP
jgi:hypothetical protein